MGFFWGGGYPLEEKMKNADVKNTLRRETEKKRKLRKKRGK